ncbi:MAG: hypothetical protein SPE21_04095, partial [Candidatus Cryptobacteroides sp.]|nr:hypothetical protein [Candidatus Cryptobacteroides sp.]
VTGRVLDKTSGKPIDQQQFGIRIYGFNTVAAARDVKKLMDLDANTFVVPDAEAYPDDNGYYEINVAETGALIFKADMKDAVLEQVNFRLEINVRIEMGNYIRTSQVSAVRDVVDVIDQRTDMEGNYLKARSSISIPDNVGKTDARLIVQPFLIDAVTKDTLRALRPLVMEGSEYAMTQHRRMNFDDSQDPLNSYLVPDTLTADALVIPWADTIYVRDPSRNYLVKGIVLFEDYNRVYDRKDYYLASSRIGRPLRFLEYSMVPYMLDPQAYRERAKREKRNTAGNMSLTFKVGQARLEDSDTLGKRQLDSIRNVLLDIIHGEGSQLKEFHITGTASPEGPLAGNQKLAKKRLDYALGQITSVLPASVRERVYMTTDAKVASWSRVAELLDADSLLFEAESVRSIVAANPRNQDRQGYLIRSLPYYKSVIAPLLPRLRSVSYSYSYEIFRELTPEEILDRYLHDEDYRSGRKQFALYEYWHLFNMVTDKDELHSLYERAYRESMELSGKPWILAACNLAASNIARGVCDTTLLSRFIDLKTHTTDFRMMRLNGNGYDLVNPEAVIANQLIMYVMAGDFRKAGQLVNILPDNDRNRMVRAFALCLGGYYKGGKTAYERAEARKVFDLVSSSSLRNKMVLCLAMNTKNYDDMAENMLEELPQDDALTSYFRCIVYCRKGARTKDFMDDIAAEDALLDCFHKDKSFIDIAANDGYVVETIFKNAKDRYDYGE